MTMTIAWEFIGALGLLLPFTLLQFGRLTQHGLVYLLLNLVGSGILTVVAVVQHQWGFVILQAVWALVAAWSIIRRTGSTARSTGDSTPDAPS